MGRGKWCLEYVYRPMVRGRFVTDGGSNLGVSLNATTEDAAIEEAKRIWDEKVAHAKARGYEKGIFCPCVVYRILL